MLRRPKYFPRPQITWLPSCHCGERVTVEPLYDTARISDSLTRRPAIYALLQDQQAQLNGLANGLGGANTIELITRRL